MRNWITQSVPEEGKEGSQKGREEEEQGEAGSGGPNQAANHI